MHAPYNVFKAMLKACNRGEKKQETGFVSHFPTQSQQNMIFIQPAHVFKRHSIMYSTSLMHSWRWRVQIHILDLVPLALALADEGGKVLGSPLTLTLDLDGLIALVAEVLDTLVKADAEVVGGEAKDLADRGGDASGVGVDIVELGKLG